MKKTYRFDLAWFCRFYVGLGMLMVESSGLHQAVGILFHE